MTGRLDFPFDSLLRGISMLFIELRYDFLQRAGRVVLVNTNSFVLCLDHLISSSYYAQAEWLKL